MGWGGVGYGGLWWGLGVGKVGGKEGGGVYWAAVS